MEPIVKYFLIFVLLYSLYSLCTDSNKEHFEEKKEEKSDLKNDKPKSLKKPNFLFIWGDDIGISNISAYSLGIMGFKTKNIGNIIFYASPNELSF